MEESLGVVHTPANILLFWVFGMLFYFPGLANVPIGMAKHHHKVLVNMGPKQAPAQAQGKFVRISFADNSLGINKERDGGKLFTLYARFHFDVKGKGRG